VTPLRGERSLSCADLKRASILKDVRAAPNRLFFKEIPVVSVANRLHENPRTVNPQLWQDMFSAWNLLRDAPSPPRAGGVD